MRLRHRLAARDWRAKLTCSRCSHSATAAKRRGWRGTSTSSAAGCVWQHQAMRLQHLLLLDLVGAARHPHRSLRRELRAQRQTIREHGVRDAQISLEIAGDRNARGRHAQLREALRIGRTSARPPARPLASASRKARPSHR